MAYANLTSAHYANPEGAGRIVYLPVDTTAASTSTTRIYKGSGVVVEDAGYSVLMSVDHTDNDVFGGVAVGDVEWTAGQSDVYIPVFTVGDFWFKHTDAALTDINAEFEPDEDTDPASVSDYATQHAVCVGRCVGYKTDWVKIRIDGYAIGSGSKHNA